jgi:hypothetical protein
MLQSTCGMTRVIFFSYSAVYGRNRGTICVDTMFASSSWRTQKELLKRSSKYVKYIYSPLYLLLLYIYIYFFLYFKLKTEWLKQRVIWDDQVKAIQETIAGFLNDQVINLKGEFYYNPKVVLKPNRDEHLYWMLSQGHAYTMQACNFMCIVSYFNCVQCSNQNLLYARVYIY